MSRKRPQPPVKPFKKKPDPLKAAKVKEIDYKDIDTLKKLSVMDCIECGLCTYVCPSKLDVTEGIRRAKRYMALVKK